MKKLSAPILRIGVSIGLLACSIGAISIVLLICRIAKLLSEPKHLANADVASINMTSIIQLCALSALGLSIGLWLTVTCIGDLKTLDRENKENTSNKASEPTSG